VIVAMIVIVTMLMRPGACWHEGDVTMAHATFRDDAIRERLHLRAFALQHRDFDATVVVEMRWIVGDKTAAESPSHATPRIVAVGSGLPVNPDNGYHPGQFGADPGNPG